MATLAAQEAHTNHCSLCNRRFTGDRFYYQEEAEAPEPRFSWVVCDACSAAVGDELAHLESRTPLRLRVALGVVAGARGAPAEERAAAADSEERTFTRIVLSTVWIAFVVHALAFVAIIVVIAHH